MFGILKKWHGAQKQIKQLASTPILIKPEPELPNARALQIPIIQPLHDTAASEMFKILGREPLDLPSKPPGAVAARYVQFEIEEIKEKISQQDFPPNLKKIIETMLASKDISESLNGANHITFAFDCQRYHTDGLSHTISVGTPIELLPHTRIQLKLVRNWGAGPTDCAVWPNVVTKHYGIYMTSLKDENVFYAGADFADFIANLYRPGTTLGNNAKPQYTLGGSGSW